MNAQVKVLFYPNITNVRPSVWFFLLKIVSAIWSLLWSHENIGIIFILQWLKKLDRNIIRKENQRSFFSDKQIQNPQLAKFKHIKNVIHLDQRISGIQRCIQNLTGQRARLSQWQTRETVSSRQDFTQQVKVLLCGPGNLRLSPRTLVKVEGKNQLDKDVLWPPQTHTQTQTCTHTNTQIN